MILKLDISKPVAKRIHKIRQRMEIRSDAEVIARALALYEFLTDEVTEGNRVLVVDETGESREVEVK